MMKSKIFSFGVLTLTIIGIVFISGCIQINQFTGSKTCRDVQVPYQEEQCQRVPYTMKNCEEFIELLYKSTHENLKGRRMGKEPEYYVEYSFDITNLDSVRGTWSFDWMKIYPPPPGSCKTAICKGITTKYREGRLTLDPSETKTASVILSPAEVKESMLYVDLNRIPSKPVCRNVVKYNTVCDNVTKYRIVQKCD